ncbi:MAG: usg protein [Rhizobiales bacterium]|nr:usg protein [Hyphomicrobiales bacterium]
MRTQSSNRHSEMRLMLQGYGLTTATILYHMPDHPHLLQTYVWQDYDLAPKFPVLLKFLDFWRSKLDGPLHSIAYTHRKLVAPNEWRNVSGELVLH